MALGLVEAERADGDSGRGGPESLLCLLLQLTLCPLGRACPASALSKPQRRLVKVREAARAWRGRQRAAVAWQGRARQGR